jgi:hypothetical protein
MALTSDKGASVPHPLGHYLAAPVAAADGEVVRS